MNTPVGKIGLCVQMPKMHWNRKGIWKLKLMSRMMHLVAMAIITL
jgi:hypothetical protein